jgi:flagellar assembly protein FliH
MSDVWSGATFAEAERVPVWTRRQVGSFSKFAGAGDAPRFSAWDAPAPPSNPPGAAMAEPAADPAAEQRLAIETEAFARGFQEGYAAAAATIGDHQDQVVRLTEALEALRPAAPGDLAMMLSLTVSRLVRQIVGEVALDTDRLADRVEAVVALIEEDGGATRIRLHPADIARLEGFTAPLPLVADQQLAEGTVVAEGANGWIEDGPAIRMERLRQALDAMASTR